MVSGVSRAPLWIATLRHTSNIDPVGPTGCASSDQQSNSASNQRRCVKLCGLSRCPGAQWHGPPRWARFTLAMDVARRFAGWHAQFLPSTSPSKQWGWTVDMLLFLVIRSYPGRMHGQPLGSVYRVQSTGNTE